MFYLQPKHEQAIRQSPALAMTLWQAGMENGDEAALKGDWHAARGFFGTAFETALLSLWNQPRVQQMFDVEHVVDAGKRLSHTLCQLGDWDEAQLCLVTLRSCLLKQGRNTGTKYAAAIAEVEALMAVSANAPDENWPCFDTVSREAPMVH